MRLVFQIVFAATIVVSGVFVLRYFGEADSVSDPDIGQGSAEEQGRLIMVGRGVLQHCPGIDVLRYGEVPDIFVFDGEKRYLIGEQTKWVGVVISDLGAVGTSSVQANALECQYSALKQGDPENRHSTMLIVSLIPPLLTEVVFLGEPSVRWQEIAVYNSGGKIEGSEGYSCHISAVQCGFYINADQ